MMPKKNGFDVCQTVKKELGMGHIHIILLTAKGQEFDRQRGQEVGADLYMTKPFDPDANPPDWRSRESRPSWDEVPPPRAVPENSARRRPRI